MKSYFENCFTAIAMAGMLILAAHSTAAVNSELRLVGLALHLETGRDIYLGAVHFDKLAPRPENLVEATGPRLMEYRVVARRTSARSLLGGMLLQGELATGTSPSAPTLKFVNNILSAVKGSLYAGDSLEILLTGDNVTIASINGYEMARASGRSVADYFLMGWVSERGPSTTFRSHISAPDIDGALMAAYSAETPSNERLDAVAGWVEEVPLPIEEKAESVATVAAAPAASSASKPAQQSHATKPAPQIAAASPQASKNVEKVAQKAPTTAKIPVSQPTSKPAPTEIEGRVQVASLNQLPDLAPAQPEGVASLGAMEYSAQLAEFNSLIIRRVYSKIRYPRGAVRRNIQGSMELDVTVNHNGEFVDVAVAHTSGNDLLDGAAMKAAKKALSGGLPDAINAVAIAEYGSADGVSIVVPVPVKFVLTEAE